MNRRKTTPATTRFWRHVNKFGPRKRGLTKCWMWRTGKPTRYPNFWDGRHQIGANRFALQLRLGRKLREGEFACHVCDHKKCVRPSHLFAGTGLDNSQDMVHKGRKEVGSRVAGAKLTEDVVLRIRIRYARRDVTLAQLAQLFGVTAENVGAVVKGYTWKHVGGPIDTRPRCRREIRTFSLRKRPV